jgi:hypothetical protein
MGKTALCMRVLMPEILALKYGNFEKDTWVISNNKRLNDQRKKPLGG